MRLFLLLLLLFTTIWSQSSSLDGNLKESGFYLDNFSLNWNPSDPKTEPTYSIGLKNLSISFNNISIQETISPNESFTDINFNGPSLNLDNLILTKKVFEPDWIARYYLHKIEARLVRPKEAIQSISDGINLFLKDNQSYPSSINELDVKAYIDMSIYPFDSPNWFYELDLPNNIFAHPTKVHPIPSMNSIQFDFNHREFLTDKITDSLKAIQKTFWDYSIELHQVSQNFSHHFEIKEWEDSKKSDYYLEKGSFSIHRATIDATPENSIHNRVTFKLPYFTLGLDNILLTRSQESHLIVESGSFNIQIRNFEINIPEGLRHEPELAQLLEKLGIWNNTLKLRQMNGRITIINRYTGELKAFINTPYITIELTGEFQLHQEGYFPEITFHNTFLEINPISMGIRAWIKDWEKSNNVTLPRKGSKVLIELDGTRLNPTFHGIK